MRDRFTLLVFLCALVASGVLFAQSAPPAPKTPAGASGSAPAPSQLGSQSAGAAIEAPATAGAGAWMVPAAIAAGLVAVGAAASSSGDGAVSTPPKH